MQFIEDFERGFISWIGLIQRESIMTLYSVDETDFSFIRSSAFPTKNEISGPVQFTFRITNASGASLNGFCLLDQTSFQLTEMDLNQQLVICILSEYYEPDVFNEILRVIRLLLLRNLNQVKSFIALLIDSPTSFKNFEFSKRLKNPYEPISKVKSIQRSILNHYDRISIFNVITAILCDCSVLLVSSDLEKLTASAYSLLSLIYPLKWHHAFSPVVPDTMIDLVQTPTPFIFGVHRDSYRTINRRTMSPHLLIDIDSHKIHTGKFPASVVTLQRSFNTISFEQIQKYILQLICSTVGVSPSHDLNDTVKQILETVRKTSYVPRSFSSFLITSRTVQDFIQTSAVESAETAETSESAESAESGERQV